LQPAPLTLKFRVSKVSNSGSPPTLDLPAYDLPFSVNQRLHKRHVVADSISGHLYRDGVRMVGGTLNESLHTVIKAVIRMMKQNVACLNGRENFDVFRK